MPYTNEDWTQVFTVTDSAGAAVNLTGATLAMMVRATEKADTVLSLTSTAGTLVVESAAAGRFRTQVPVATMLNVPPGLYVYDVRSTTGSVVKRLFGGTIDVIEGVTR
jgi:hypothetical protein